jgi:hypothetical protein
VQATDEIRMGDVLCTITCAKRIARHVADSAWAEAAAVIKIAAPHAAEMLEESGFRLGMKSLGAAIPYYADVLAARNNFARFDQAVREQRHHFTAAIHAALTGTDELLSRRAEHYVISLGFKICKEPGHGAITREQLIEAFSGPAHENINELVWSIFSVAHRKAVYEQKRADAKFKDTAESLVHREFMERVMQPRKNTAQLLSAKAASLAA